MWFYCRTVSLPSVSFWEDLLCHSPHEALEMPYNGRPHLGSMESWYGMGATADDREVSLAPSRDHQSSINFEYIPELESEVQMRSREELRILTNL